MRTLHDIHTCLILRLVSQPQQQSAASPGMTLSVLAHNGVPSPAASPMLNQRGGPYGRGRAVSVVNPNPVIKLVLDGVAKRVCPLNCDCKTIYGVILLQLQSIRKLLDDEFFAGLLKNTTLCVKDCSLSGKHAP